ncbi:hypothetical protein OBE_15342, partial [human gut metagenome]
SSNIPRRCDLKTCLMRYLSWVDEELRPVIELIYKLYTEEGIGRKKICDILNSKYNYPTPSVYYQMKHLERGRIYKHPVQKLWSTYMIRNILENDVYVAHLELIRKRLYP